MTAKLELRGVTKEFVVRPSKDQPAARVLRALDETYLCPGEPRRLQGE